MNEKGNEAKLKESQKKAIDAQIEQKEDADALAALTDQINRRDRNVDEC